MTNINEDARARREAARQTTGEFGEHTRSAPELALGATPESPWPLDLGGEGDWGTVTVEYGGKTPWGDAQHPSREADGVVFVSTDGHGGYKLSPERNAAIPSAYRKKSGWYEEDTERYIVEFYHHDALFNRPQDADRDRDENLARLDEGLRNWYPKAWERVNKRTLEPGESRTKDTNEWTKAHADEYVVTGQRDLGDGAMLLTAKRQSTGDVDTFLTTTDARNAAQDAGLNAIGANGRFVVPEGAQMQPREVPEVKPAFTNIPTIDHLPAAGQKRVLNDLGKQWRLRKTGEVISLRRQIAEGHITSKSAYITDGGARQYHLNNDNTGSAIQVARETFEAFEAPDTRTPRDHADEKVQIARAKLDKAHRTVEKAFRPTAAQHQAAREAMQALNDAQAARDALSSD